MRYEDALALYQQARQQRPYNVYPKVKIQDVRALIQARDAQERPPDEPLPEEPVIAVPVLSELDEADVPPPTKEPVPVVVPDKEERAVEPARPERPEDRPVPPPIREPNVPPTPKAVQEAEYRDMPEGFAERIFREGGHIVTERRVNGPEGEVVYRRVLQSWGGVQHFRNGVAVPERVWTEAFDSR
jgi:hypothetical protein